jgi:hypothetical protein
MIDSILRALGEIKADVARHLEASLVTQVCRELNYVWRDRILDPVTTVHAFLLQVLHGNTACDHVPQLIGKKFSGEAYGQARARLPLELFRRLLGGVCESLAGCREEAARWCGHRVWLVDGSSCSMPDTPELQAAFGQPGGQRPGCGFPVAHLLTLFHAGTGLLQEVLIAPLRTHDMSQVAEVHPHLEPGDVLVADRGFCSFVHLALLVRAAAHGVFRVHQRVVVDFRRGRLHRPARATHPIFRDATGLPRSAWIRWQGHWDHVVEYFKPARRPRWMTAEAFAALPDVLEVREVRYTIGRRGFRTRTVELVTTLLDPTAYPLAELAQLYYDRWRIEVNLRHLKQTLHLDVLRSKTVVGVEKEIRMLALVYNLVRLVMLRSAELQHAPVERVSFVDALRWLMHGGDRRRLPALVTHPLRPDRFEPRVRKRRPKEYDLMNRPRLELKRQLPATQRHAT